MANSADWQPSSALSWLQRLVVEAEKIDQVRYALQSSVKAEYSEVRLQDALQDIAAQAGFHLTIYEVDMDLIGLNPTASITFEQTGGSEANDLRQILDPLKIAYVLGPQGVLVTSKHAAQADPIDRYYDLCRVLSTVSQAKPLVDSIELTIDPDSWLSAGGTSRIQLVGSIMVVAAPDSTQTKIEVLLANWLRLRGAGKLPPSEPRDAPADRKRDRRK